MKVLFTRGRSIYVVQIGNLYYLVNLNPTDINSRPVKSEYISSFLKFGYFDEVNDAEVPEDIKQKIAKAIKEA